MSASLNHDLLRTALSDIAAGVARHQALEADAANHRQRGRGAVAFHAEQDAAAALAQIRADVLSLARSVEAAPIARSAA